MPHQKAIAALAQAADLDPDSSRFDELCAVSHAWHVSADAPHDVGFRFAALLLEGSVVERGHGGAAFEVLLSRLHGEAGAASRSDLNTWWSWLHDARLPLIGSTNGTAAQRLTAERRAESAYRCRLAERTDVVESFLLSDDAPSITIPDLLSTVRVSRTPTGESGFELVDVIRRHRHLVLEGLPGSGKSTAIGQLAARFAADREAPLPIVVKLPRACADVDDPHDLTVELLVADAVRAAPEDDRAVLTDILVRELGAGFALLICDGLDECRTRAGAVAVGLAGIRQRLGRDCGMIVTTRPSAGRPARRIGARHSSLLTPARNTVVQHRILDMVMDDPDLTESTRALRHAELERVQRAQPDIAGVPLLGNLVALLIGSGRETIDRPNVAELIEAAVRQALSRWERRRGGEVFETVRLPALLTVEMLWDGFIAIGHLIAEEDGPSRGDVITRVSAMLGESWHIGGREAAVLAGHIVAFWDETISVFVEDRDGVVAARSRVLADIADAIWICTAAPSERRRWIIRTLSDETRYNNLLLAAMKDPHLPELAMTVVEHSESRRRLAEWLCDAVDQLSLSDETLTNVLEVLVTEAHAAGDWETFVDPAATTEHPWSMGRQDRKDGHAWPFVWRAALLPVPPPLRPVRDGLIAQVREDPERALTAAALAATTDADFDARPLTDYEIRSLSALLHLSPPAGGDDPFERTGRNEYATGHTESMISGRPEAVLRAARVVSQLPDGSAEAIARTSPRTPGSYAVEIEIELEKHGYTGPLREQLARFELPPSLTDPSPLARLLGRIAVPTEATRGAVWWCRETFRLYDLMDVGGTVSVELQLAGEEPHRSTLERLARLYCNVNGIDTGMVAAQVEAVARRGDSALKHLEWMAIAFASDETRTRLFTTVDTEAREVLAAALTSACTWLGELSFFVSAALTDVELSADLVERLPSVHPWGRRWATLAACRVSADSAATAAQLMSRDALTRAAVAKFLRVTDDGSERVRQLMATLRCDEDLLVRQAAAGERPVPAGAARWTCSWCAETNNIVALDCGHCQHGSRPPVEAD